MYTLTVLSLTLGIHISIHILKKFKPKLSILILLIFFYFIVTLIIIINMTSL